MKDIFEKIVLAVLVIALILACLGLVLSVKVLITIALVLLMAVSVAFGVMQVITYLRLMGTKDEGQALIMMIISFVVCLAIIVLSILTFAGKIFGLY